MRLLGSRSDRRSGFLAAQRRRQHPDQDQLAAEQPAARQLVMCEIDVRNRGFPSGLGHIDLTPGPSPTGEGSQEADSYVTSSPSLRSGEGARG
jgi:hypothetical protein